MTMVASEQPISLHNAVKRRRVMEGSGDSSNDSPIHRLTDELLVEILHRLPCSKPATQCKTVCKRWLALIGSDPLFLRTFITRRRQEAELRLPFGLFAQYMTSDIKSSHGVREFVSDDPAAFQASDLSLSFLPCQDPDKIWILASHNDLLLCCPNSFDHSVYYLCNPLTKQWLALPPPPSHQTAGVSNITGRIRVGFVCDPYYDCSLDNPTVINRGYKFKLVCIPPLLGDGSAEFEVEIFSSQSCQWSTSIVKLPPLSNLKGYIINTVSYNGMLHWVDGIKGYIDIVGLNPTEGEHATTCHFISRPLDSPRGIMGCFGVCKGRLRVSLLQTRRDLIAKNDAPSFRIWELKDYHTSEWALLHELCFNQLCSNNSMLSKYTNYNGPVAPITALAFHPYDEDVIYFQFLGYVTSCNLRTRRLQVAGRLPPVGLEYHGVFPLVLPDWPTPLPILESISK